MHLLWLELTLVSVQTVLGLNEPPAPPSLQAMLPVGEEAPEPLVSATVAVKTTEPPAVVLAGLGVNVVVVEWDGAFATAYESPP